MSTVDRAPVIGWVDVKYFKPFQLSTHTYPTDASTQMFVALSMATCRTTYGGHHEGWGPVSTLREFDLTPCFEEGIVLSTLLVVLLVVSLSRLWGTKSKATRYTLTARSASALKAKLVGSVVTTGINR